MKQNKKKLKGFTLVELIVVMAVFTIILLVVMSLVDPVSKIMNNTSAKERSASYVDNIEDYMESSMKYAKFMRVYEGGFCDVSGTPLTEQEAVTAFVDSYFDGYIDSDLNLISGKVRVIKICNDPITTDVGATVFGNGEVVETIWDFTAGDKYTKIIPDPTIVPPDPTKTIETYPVKVAPVVTAAYADMLTNPENYMVINPEHYQRYSYFFKLGYNTFDAVPDSVAESYGATISDNRKFYYSEINKGVNLSGNDVPLGQDSFSLSVIAYERGNKFDFMIDTDGNATPDTLKTLFRSPSYMSNTSMALLNVINSGQANQAVYYRIKQDESGNNVIQDGKEVLEETDIKALPFEHYDDLADTSNNIYFIYSLPNELSY